MTTNPACKSGVQLSAAQWRVLVKFGAKEFEFPQTGSDSNVCRRLESAGLLEGQLEPAVWDSRRGITKYARAYKLSKAGRRLVKSIRK